MTDPSLPPESRAAEDNVARLIAVAYRPDAPDPAFVRRVAERMDAEAARMRGRPSVSVAPIAPAGDVSPAFVPSSMARLAWVCASALMLVAGAVIVLRGGTEHALPRDVGAMPVEQAPGARGGTTTVVTPLAPQQEPDPKPPKEPEPKPPEPDARMRAAMQKAAWLTENPVFKSHAFEVRVADPYVVVQEYVPLTGDESHKNPDRVATAKRLADRNAILLTELHRRFRELFAERFKLPELRDKGRVLLAVAAWDDAAFRAISRKADGELPSGDVVAVYEKSPRRMLFYVGTEALTGQDELPTADDRVQKGADQTAMRVGAIQLLDEYSALRRGVTLTDDGADSPGVGCLWFVKGLAGFLGAIEVERSRKHDLVGATFLHGRLALDRIAIVREDRDYFNAARKWTIPELVRAKGGDLLDRGEKLHPADGEAMRRLFSVRSWGLVHFLWFYDGGKYRSGFLDFMEAALDGTDGPDTLAKCLGRPSAADWSGIDAEFEWYWTQCVSRQVGWKNPGSRSHPYDTDTDPPKGRYDPDAVKDPDEDDEK